MTDEAEVVTWFIFCFIFSLFKGIGNL